MLAFAVPVVASHSSIGALYGTSGSGATCKCKGPVLSSATTTGPATRRIPVRGGLSTPPPESKRAPFPDGRGGLRWKDRVALYAQFSAEETLDELLLALRANAGSDGDDGIDALYAFANVDIWELTHRFFGKTQDLGQFERFKRVVVAHPYSVLLREDYTMRTLSALHVADGCYVARREFVTGGNAIVFVFTMRRLEFGASAERTAWMVDSIIRDDAAEGGIGE